MSARFPWKRLKNASIIFTLSFGLLAVLAAGQTILNSRTETLRNAALDEAVTVRAQGAALAFAKALSEDWQRTKWTANRMLGASNIQRQEALEALVSTPGRIGWAGFADTNGTIREASGGLLLGQNVSERPWFQNGLRGPYAGDAHDAVLLARILGNDEEEPIRFIDFAVPVIDGQGRTLGVLGVHIDVRWAEAYLAEISSTLGIDLLVIGESGSVSVSGMVADEAPTPRQLDRLPVDAGQLVEWTDGGFFHSTLVPEPVVDDMPAFGWRMLARIEPQALSNLSTPANGLQGSLQSNSDATSLQVIFAALASVAAMLGTAAVFFNARAQKSNAAVESAIRRLQTSEQRFMALFGTATLPIAILRDKKFQVVNEAAARLLGYDRPSDLEGKSFLEISPEFQADGMRSIDKVKANQADMAKGTARFDWMHLKADGTPILLDIIVSVVHSEDGDDVFSVWTDVTAQRKAEETVRDYQTMLERAVSERTEELEAAHSALRIAKDQSDQLAKLRSDFLATMSHEIRGPLNSLIGFVELASEGNLTKQQAGFLAKAVQAGRHLASIVDDVLDLTRAEAGRLTLEHVEFDLVDFAHSTLEAIEPSVRNKPVDLVLAIDPELPERITADPLRLRQILMNYLTNAAKFTERGTICLRAHRVDTDGKPHLRFAVEDSGIGLRPEQKERLFQSFSQADISTARLYGGSGLGLAICQQLATLMEGSVGFDSEAGQGSSFWFDLPCEGHVCAGEPPAIATTGAGKTVWLGLANDAAEKSLRLWLKREGFRVEALGAAPPPYAETILIYDQAATKTAPWLETGTYPNRFLLTSEPDEGKKSGIRRIKMPVHPRKLLALLGAVAAPATKAAETIPERQTYPKHLKVLVADDDELNRDLAKARLSRLGLTVRTACDGTEVLQAVLEERFDLILIDHQMPVINGIEATRRIRALPPPRGLTPIVGISGSDRPEVRQACVAAGMNGFLLKPLSNAGLAEILSTHLPA